MTANLGLTRQQRIAMESRIAESEAHGGRIPRHGAVGALGQAVNTETNVTINIHGGDPNAVQAAVYKAIQKYERHNTPTRRGRYGGKH